MSIPPMFEWAGLIPHADVWQALQRALSNDLVADYFIKLSAPRETVERLLKNSLLGAIEQSANTVKLEMVYSGISNSYDEGYTQLIGPNLRLGGTDALVDNKHYTDVTVCGHSGVWQGVQRIDKVYD